MATEYAAIRTEILQQATYDANIQSDTEKYFNDSLIDLGVMYVQREIPKAIYEANTSNSDIIAAVALAVIAYSFFALFEIEQGTIKREVAGKAVGPALTTVPTKELSQLEKRWLDKADLAIQRFQDSQGSTPGNVSKIIGIAYGV